jgi:hypothetical protein
MLGFITHSQNCLINTSLAKIPADYVVAIPQLATASVQIKMAKPFMTT